MSKVPTSQVGEPACDPGPADASATEAPTDDPWAVLLSLETGQHYGHPHQKPNDQPPDDT